MGYLTFFGSLLFVFGPPLALFVLVIAKSNQLIILAIGSAFFWLLSILLTAVVWFVIAPLRGVLPFIIPFAVILQEAMRYVFWRLYDKAYNQSEALKNDTTKPPNFLSSLAIGWGIGTTMTLIMQTSVLTNALGPGDLPAPACPSMSLFHIHALTSEAMLWMHIVLSVIAFDAYARRSWKLIAFVVASHLVFSFSSLLTQVSCIAVVAVSYVILGGTCFVAWRTITSSYNTLLRYQKDR